MTMVCSTTSRTRRFSAMGTSILPLLGAVATVIAAFLTAVIALVNMLNSKDQKTTEFRQQWINALRGHISEFAAQARWIGGAVEQAKRFDPNCFSRDSKAYDSYASSRERISVAYYSICLHFKPSDKDFASLDTHMREVLTLLARPSELRFGTVSDSLGQLTDEAKRILKTEWKRVKAGELTYRITKYAAMLVILGSLIGGSFLASVAWPSLSKARAAIEQPSHR
jgi:hypothetical protein